MLEASPDPHSSDRGVAPAGGWEAARRRDRAVARSARRRARRRRLRLFALLVVAAGALVGAHETGLLWATPSGPPLTPLQARIVSIADSQLGVATSPADTYCNRYSAYWGAGSSQGCSAGLLAEEWCADFAAWVWQKAGVPLTYGTAPGDLNGDAVSFYTYGLAHHTWHPIGPRFTPRAGDVAVYGLDAGAGTVAHVAVVTSFTPGSRGPNVVNGDGDRTAFSIVEPGTDQWKADVHDDGGRLAGYVAPFVPTVARPK